MRKKKLLEQNTLLFEQVKHLEIELALLKKEISKKDARIKELLKSETEETKKSLPETKEEPKIIEDSEIIDDITSFGSDIIGEVVLKATELSNELSNEKTGENKELINLILGRTEVAKSEILAISENQDLDAEIKNKMESVRDNAFEYFESVMAQRDRDV